MYDAFLIALREALQCAILLGLFLLYPPIRSLAPALLAGAFGGFALGAIFSWIPAMGAGFSSNDIWLPFRMGFEFTLIYSGVIVMLHRFSPPGWMVSGVLAVLGFMLGFFDARSAGFVIHDLGHMKSAELGVPISGVMGAIAGFLPLFALRWTPRRRLIEESLDLQSVLLLAGTLKIMTGGVSGIDEGTLMIALQRGLGAFLTRAVEALQSVILLSGHEFLRVPFSGLARYLAGESTAMSLMVIAVMTPPVLLLLSHFSRPDPYVDDIEIAARRRLEVSFFRREFIMRALPLVISFVLVIIAIHASNVSLNPLSEPDPVPVREDEGTGTIRIALADRLGDLSDGKLRKYLYYYGQNQILFLAVMKPDGSVGLALDECEICRPAQWNVDARGYAQRGENLVCKYCMTPIPIPTINKPGGCNPIPLPHKTGSGVIVISIEDLIRTYNEAQKLEKKGTHF